MDTMTQQKAAAGAGPGLGRWWDRVRKAPDYWQDIRVSITNARHPEPARPDRLLSIEQSIEKLVREPKSLIRLCDGECNIMTRTPIYFQRYHPALRRGLYRILREYVAGRECPYHLAMPNSILLQSRAEIEASGTLYIWRRTRHIYFRHGQTPVRNYLEAQLFKTMERDRYEAILRLFAGAGPLFVVNDQPELARFHLPDERLRIHEIRIRPYHVFSDYDVILASIRSALARWGSADPAANRVLVGAGPCGKLLIHELAHAGVVALDIGKFFHSQRRFAAVPIPEKSSP